ncbi:MAG: type 4a pilus biogenesis protein PilO [Holophagaceae bacterium]|nr:type 4a pilus biogenesis protein PilO [Holophagaceae bacterium]
MSSAIGKQFLFGFVGGLVATGLIWYLLGGMREDIASLIEQNGKLETEVTKGRQLKASYEVLKKEVEEQEVRIAELVKLFALDGERSRATQQVGRLASNAGLGRMQEQKNNDKPINSEYYSEWETTYRYIGGFHEYGEFLSYVSGFEKIINISDITLDRNTNSANRNTYPVTINFRLSVYVYNPKSDEQIRAAARPGR